MPNYTVEMEILRYILTNINTETPFPIPFTVICSPIHTKNVDPASNVSIINYCISSVSSSLVAP